MKQLTKYKPILADFLFYIAILFFIIGFNFSDNMVNGWYQQFMPNLGGRQITDIFFLDSLTGWAITPYATQNDTFYVLKTTNAGDNWIIQYILTGQFVGNNSIFFINQNTGYTCGTSNFPTISSVRKTTSGGVDWFNLNSPDPFLTLDDIFVLNEDTMWLAASSSATGGVFYTSNGGLNWTQQVNLGGSNPDRIYMYNARIGFIGRSSGCCLYRTMNGGANWSLIANNEGFNDMFFIDSLTGWKSPPMKKTTDGGLNWIQQILPTGGNIYPGGNTFSLVNNDTIWVGGGYKFFPGIGGRGIINVTTNGGNNWLFQFPDTSFGIPQYPLIQFTNKLNGWGYFFLNGGVHTTTGGNDTFYTSITPKSTEVPNEYKLYQNYPNPFNPVTKIRCDIKRQTSNVKLIVYDITGREIAELINEKLNAGTFEIIFDGSKFSSGIYFYSLIIDGKLTDTKKMILIK